MSVSEKRKMKLCERVIVLRYIFFLPILFMIKFKERAMLYRRMYFFFSFLKKVLFFIIFYKKKLIAYEYENKHATEPL